MFSWKKILGVLLCLVVICSMASLAVSCSEEDEELSYTITKTATAVDTAGDGIINNAGEIIEYTVEVENTGNTTITGVSVSESLSITLTRQADDPGNDDTDLDEGESWVYTGSYTVQQSDLDDGTIENTATVSSNELGDKSDTEEVTCGETPFTGDTVKIGVILPLSGFMAIYGQEFKHGIEFVLEQMEDEGALNGADIEIVWADDQGDPQQSVIEMTRLCTTENVCAVLGPWATDCGNAACPLADTYQIPNIGLHVGGEVLSTLNLEYWRTILPEGIPGDVGRSMVDFIKYCIDNYDLPHDSIVLAAVDTTVGATQRASILERLEEYGLDDNVVLDIVYDMWASSMDQYALQCKAKDPDIMIAQSFPFDLAGWIRSMQTIDYYPNFFITNEMVFWEAYTQMFISPDIYNAVFNDEHTACFALVSVHETIGIESCEEFAEEYSDWCEAKEMDNSYDQGGAVTGAQVMYALWDALEIAGEPDPEKINDALRTLRIDVDDSHFVYPALAPALEWESNGNLKYTTQFACQLQDGEKVILWPEEYKQGDPQW